MLIFGALIVGSAYQEIATAYGGGVSDPALWIFRLAAVGDRKGRPL